MKRSLFSLFGIVACLGVPGAPLPAAQGQGGLADAAGYCRAVGNIDQPGSPYTGPKLPRWMPHALSAEQAAPGQIDWRCMGGRVYACFDAGGSAHCGKADISRTPTPAMYQACRANPNASELPGAVVGSLTVFNWACRGRNPIIVQQHTRVDPRGYPVGLYDDVTMFAPAASADPSTVITTDGMLGISVGMSVRQIAHLINQPGNYSQAEGVNTYECQVYDLRSDLGQVMVQKGAVTSIVTSSPRLGTPAGVKVGMPEVSLRRAYGQRLIRQPSEYRGASYYFHSNSGNGIRFGVADGKIQFIAAGRRNSIELSEGCL